jgi:hypothetical protein
VRATNITLNENELGWLYRAVVNERKRNPISDKRHWDRLRDRICEAQARLRD